MAGRSDYFEQPIDGIEVFDSDGKSKFKKLTEARHPTPKIPEPKKGNEPPEEGTEE